MSLMKRVAALGLLLGTLHAGAAAQAEDTEFPAEEIQQLVDVLGLIKSGYVSQVDDKKLIAEAISGMVASLDPHSRYLGKEEMEELESGTFGLYTGVGIEAEAENGVVTVIAPIEDSPADRAGIRTGDVIVRIDATPVQGLPLDRIGRLIRGAPHTKVALTIARKGESKVRTVNIVREELQEQSVKARMVRPGFLWVRVSQFQLANVDDLVRKINDACTGDCKLDGLVLDLRNDPGGLAMAAVGVAGAFLPRDALVFTTEGRLPAAKAAFYVTPDHYAAGAGTDPLEKLPASMKTVPMIVLVNGGSASASEIVAGALQDHRRATIMGTQTFGKGSVQAIRRLSESSGIKLTVARYYTSGGRSIQAKGITPDITVGQDGEGLLMREADLQGHLDNDRQAQDEDRRHTLPTPDVAADVPAVIQKDSTFGSESDFQLLQAIKHLEGLSLLRPF